MFLRISLLRFFLPLEMRCYFLLKWNAKYGLPSFFRLFLLPRQNNTRLLRDVKIGLRNIAAVHLDSKRREAILRPEWPVELE